MGRGRCKGRMESIGKGRTGGKADGREGHKGRAEYLPVHGSGAL